MTTLKRKVEAVLFSAGKFVELKDVTKFAGRGLSEEEVQRALEELRDDYEKSDSSMMILQEGNMWKLGVRDNYVPVARRLVNRMDMKKSVMETLAVIAFKAPVIQSYVVKVRTNKAYDDIRELEERGYITRKPEGRSKRIDVTQKFFEYFDIPPDQLERRFQRIQELQREVDELDEKYQEAKSEHKEMNDEAKRREEEQKAFHAEQAKVLEQDIANHPGIALDKTLSEEELEAHYAGQVEETHEHLGPLEVVDAQPVNEQPPEGDGKQWGSLTIVNEKGEEIQTEEPKESQSEDQESESIEEPTDTVEPEQKEVEHSKRLFQDNKPEGLDAAIEQRARELQGHSEESEEKEEAPEQTPEPEQAPEEKPQNDEESNVEENTQDTKEKDHEDNQSPMS